MCWVKLRALSSMLAHICDLKCNRPIIFQACPPQKKCWETKRCGRKQKFMKSTAEATDKEEVEDNQQSGLEWVLYYACSKSQAKKVCSLQQRAFMTHVFTCSCEKQKEFRIVTQWSIWKGFPGWIKCSIRKGFLSWVKCAWSPKANAKYL